jgi:5-methylcytosine-specific restriction endonuclease McrA
MTPLDSISDDDLHVRVRRLTARSNVTLADLLAHLGEVEARGIHRERACATLHAYCIYELRMSEDAAFRRAKAARLVREYPELYAMVAKGELHLTGLLMLAPLLGGERHAEALERARFRTKREIQKLVARMDPKPAVAPSIEPLGPSPGRPTYAAFIESLCGPVRELRVGDRPEDWIDDGDESEDDGPPWHDEASPDEAPSDAEGGEPPRDQTARAAEPMGPPERPLHYKVQFTASQEYVDLVDQVFDLLGHAPKAKELPEVQIMAMRALVRQLKKQKRAAADRPRASQAETADDAAPERVTNTPERDALRAAPERVTNATRDATTPRDAPTREAPRAAPERLTDTAKRVQSAAVESVADTAKPRDEHRAAPERGASGKRVHRSRHIPAAVARAVWARDGEQCAYVDDRGQRCRETRLLELHHRHAHALEGPSTVDNLEVRCRAHNLLAAEAGKR